MFCVRTWEPSQCHRIVWPTRVFLIKCECRIVAKGAERRSYTEFEVSNLAATGHSGTAQDPVCDQAGATAASVIGKAISTFMMMFSFMGFLAFWCVYQTLSSRTGVQSLETQCYQLTENTVFPSI